MKKILIIIGLLLAPFITIGYYLLISGTIQFIFPSINATDLVFISILLCVLVGVGLIIKLAD